LAALFLVALRVVLGLAGSRYLRFSSFPLRPGEVLRYFSDAIRAKTKRYPGNNPGSAAAAVLMFLLVPALAATGTDWTGRMREDAHEIAAWGLLAVVGLHLLGIVWHTLRHRENIAASMVTGRKRAEDAESIPSSNTIPGLLLLVLGGAWILALFSGHQPGAASVKLPLLGMDVPLAGDEPAEHGKTKDKKRGGGESCHREHDDD
jgi:cytochrome b